MKKITFALFTLLLSSQVFCLDHEFFEKKCSNPKIIEKLIIDYIFENRISHLSDRGEDLIKGLEANCPPSKMLSAEIEKLRTAIKEKREKLVGKVLKSIELKRNKCDFKYAETVESIKLIDHNPDFLSKELAEKIRQHLQTEISYIENESMDCPIETIRQLKCSAGNIRSLEWLWFLSRQKSIKGRFAPIYKEVVKDCISKRDAALKRALKNIFYKNLIPNSIRNEFEYQLNRYRYSYSLGDANKIKENLIKIATELNDNDLLLRAYRLTSPGSKQAFLDRAQKRKNSCQDIDLTNYYNKPGGKQGGIGYCYGFTSAGMLNNALGVDDVNPLYLHILAIKTFFKTPTITKGGGNAHLTSWWALGMKNYCSLSDLFNPWESSMSTLKIISKAEDLFKNFLKEPKDIQGQTLFFNKYMKFIKTLLPKITLEEFLKVIKDFKGTESDLIKNLVISQCKTPFPKESEHIQIRSSYNLDFKEVDHLLNSGQIFTFNHAYSGLFQDDLSNILLPDHGVLITGRQWNDDEKRCEYRVVNSHGEQCTGVFKNDDVYCSEQTGMWVSESYLKLLHFSHEYILGELPERRPYHPAMDPDAVE